MMLSLFCEWTALVSVYACTTPLYHIIEKKQEKIFESQLQTVEKSRLAKNDTSIFFLVHVGDLMSAFFSKCREHMGGG